MRRLTAVAGARGCVNRHTYWRVQYLNILPGTRVVSPLAQRGLRQQLTLGIDEHRQIAGLLTAASSQLHIFACNCCYNWCWILPIREGAILSVAQQKAARSVVLIVYRHKELSARVGAFRHTGAHGCGS